MQAAINAPLGHRFFTNFPPLDMLPAEVAKLAREYQKLERVAADAELAANALTAEALDTEAQEADDAARTAAVRAGKDPAAVGRPAVDALEARRDEARSRWLACDRAVKDVAGEIMQALIDIDVTGDPKATGRARLEKALDAYSAAVADMVAARDAAAVASALPAFIRKASRAYALTATYSESTAGIPMDLPIPPHQGAAPGSARTSPAALAAWLVAEASDADAWMTGGAR